MAIDTGTGWVYNVAVWLVLATSLSTTAVAQVGSLSAKPAVDTLTVEQLTAMCEAALDSFGVPGMAIGIIKDGKVLLERGFGVRTLGPSGKTQNSGPVDADTRFAIASNTKAFVGTSLAMLAADGKLSLEDTITKLLPYLQWADPRITPLLNVTDLLAHRAGLGTYMGDHLWFKQSLSPREVLTKVRHLDMAYPFRAGYGYSNLGFMAAGEVIYEVSGLPWDAFVKQNLWQPLGMTRTVAHVDQLPNDDNFASGHISRQGNVPIDAVAWENIGAAGGIWSTSHDMLQWIEANLHHGVLAGDTIWPASVQDETWKPHNTFGGVPGFSSYGLGWFLSNVDGHTVASHGGGYDGMYSQVLLVTDLDLGIVVLTNSMTGLSGRLARQIASVYMGRGQDDWLTKGMSRERSGDAEWFARQDSVSRRIAAVASQPDKFGAPSGTYDDVAYGRFTVEEAGDGNYRLTFPNTEALDAALSPAGGDHYKMTWLQPSAWFDAGLAYLETGADGSPVLRLYIPNDDIFYDSVRARRVE